MKMSWIASKILLARLAEQIKRVYADKAYDSKDIRESLNKENIKDRIPYRETMAKQNPPKRNPAKSAAALAML